MNPVRHDLPYGPGPRHLGDLYPPTDYAAPVAPVLLVHGGGWNALSKESIAPIARLAAAAGHAVFSINYRLLDHAPWPACHDDCLAAARFILADGLARYGLPAPAGGQVLVCGASAGGHLAMLTGLTLGARECAGIISLAGPSRLVPGPTDTAASAIARPRFHASFFGLPPEAAPTDADLRAASPSALVTSDAPPLRCIHSRHDQLVPPAHSEEAVAAWRAVCVPARLDTFAGRDDAHGFWIDGDLTKRIPTPEFLACLRRVFPARSDSC